MTTHILNILSISFPSRAISSFFPYPKSSHSTIPMQKIILIVILLITSNTQNHWARRHMFYTSQTINAQNSKTAIWNASSCKKKSACSLACCPASLCVHIASSALLTLSAMRRNLFYAERAERHDFTTLQEKHQWCTAPNEEGMPPRLSLLYQLSQHGNDLCGNVARPNAAASLTWSVAMRQGFFK